MTRKLRSKRVTKLDGARIAKVNGLLMRSFKHDQVMKHSRISTDVHPAESVNITCIFIHAKNVMHIAPERSWKRNKPKRQNLLTEKLRCKPMIHTLYESF